MSWLKVLALTYKPYFSIFVLFWINLSLDEIFLANDLHLHIDEASLLGRIRSRANDIYYRRENPQTQNLVKDAKQNK